MQEQNQIRPLINTNIRTFYLCRFCYNISFELNRKSPPPLYGAGGAIMGLWGRETCEVRVGCILLSIHSYAFSHRLPQVRQDFKHTKIRCPSCPMHYSVVLFPFKLHPASPVSNWVSVTGFVLLGFIIYPPPGLIKLPALGHSVFYFPFASLSVSRQLFGLRTRQRPGHKVPETSDIITTVASL